MEYLINNGLKLHHIVKICHVSERTARRWLSHHDSVPKAMKRLLEIEFNGRVMPDKWPEHYRFNSLGLLEGDSTHDALSWKQIAWYSYAVSGWHESLRLVPELKASIDYLTNKIPKADVIKLEEYRKRLDELKKQSMMTPEEAVLYARGILDEEPPKKEIHRLHGC
ncbi:hypothetical protein HBA55_34580 [Pseudomaricurvus alkylphenolicus]|uniref:hypothetical protein n=1 Tax=Pseudomaricurvus alkylphenolicus TaxID=1306991 RepID=UPI00141EDD17|nr:hypothetical protein [Pseudomaricurvus alkylphenolicus]NIB44758.1 hypothetical protein [Pseudomaricurvus alkylphenolicus]